MRKIICKIFGLPLYKKGDRFIFEGLGKFKIIGNHKYYKSYDIVFYEFDRNNYERKEYTIISDFEIEENILIHKI